MFFKGQYLVHSYLIQIYVTFFFIDISYNIENYADDAALYECAPCYNKLKENLELTIYKIFNWFKYKCHFFLSFFLSFLFLTDGAVIKSSNSQKRLGVTIDSNFIVISH